MTPGRGLALSIGVYVATIAAVVILWALVGSFTALIVLLVAFVVIVGSGVLVVRELLRNASQSPPSG